MSGQHIDLTNGCEIHFADLESSERKDFLHEYGQDLFDLFESRVVNAASPTGFEMNHDTRTSDSSTTVDSKDQTESNSEINTSKHNQALLRARIDNPNMTWLELSKLKEVFYTPLGCERVFSIIKSKYISDPSSIDKYVQEGYLTKAEIETLFKNSKKTKTLRKRRRPQNSKKLKKIQALLRAKIDNPNMTWLELSKLKGVDYAYRSIPTIYTTINSEYLSDPSSIDKYVQKGYLTKAELKALFEPLLVKKKKRLKYRQALLEAKGKNPELSWGEIVKLNEILGSSTKASDEWHNIQKNYKKKAASIKQYAIETYLTENECNLLLKSLSSVVNAASLTGFEMNHDTRTSDSSTTVDSKDQTESNSEINTSKYNQALLRARIDNPNMTWLELSKLEEVFYTPLGCERVFSIIKSKYISDPSSIDKYVQEEYLTKAEIETLFKNSKKTKTLRKRRRPQNSKKLKKIQALLRAKIDNPNMTWQELSKLQEVNYTYQSISTIFKTINSEYFSDPSSIDKYVQEGYLTKAELKPLFEKPLIKKKKRLKYRQALLEAKCKNPELSWKEIVKLNEMLGSSTKASNEWHNIQKNYKKKAASINQYAIRTFLTENECNLLLKSLKA